MDTKNKIEAAYDEFVARMCDTTNNDYNLALRNAIFVGIGGSTAYGTQTPTSDVDLRGIFIGGEQHYFGLSNIEQVEVTRADGSGEKDVMMELRKFVNLALANNPNILEQLFLLPEHNLFVTEEFKMLLDNRQLFLSKKAKHSYSGYAFSQLKRIQGHYNWLTNPPKEPVRANYLVTRYKNKHTGKVIPEGDYLKKKERINAISNSSNGESVRFFEDLANWEPFEDVDKDAWNEVNSKWEQYQDWRKNRNKTRADLEAKHSFDTKHASHLVRLLLQGKQILEHHDLSTYLQPQDLQFVKDIRSGSMNYPQLIAWADKMDKTLAELYETSSLRHAPEHKKIEKLCIEITKGYFMHDEKGK
jgi:predicted nucleotidyltransferase